MAKINSRDKGARGEREWAAVLAKYGFESRRGAQNGVKDGHDIDGDIPGWRGEVKRREKAEWSRWWAQACDAALPDRLPYVAWRRNHGAWRVRCYSMDLYGTAAQPSSSDHRGMMIEMDGEDFLRLLSRRRDARASRPAKATRVDSGPATSNVAG